MEHLNRRAVLKLLSSAPVAAGFALTEADVRAYFRPAPPAEPAPLYNPGPQLREPSTTARGHGRLELRMPPVPDTARHPLPTPYFVLLTRPDQPKYLRLSHWDLLHALKPGRYRVAVLLSDYAVMRDQARAHGQSRAPLPA